MLLTVGDHDGIFTPVHEYKFAASLQSAVGSASPVLLEVQSDAGYGPETAASKQRDADVNRVTFLLAALHYIP
jgi:prolyl oligopeptidase PreP (S9A serine peptidase family)